MCMFCGHAQSWHWAGIWVFLRVQGAPHSLCVCLLASLSPSWCWSGPIQSKTLPSLLKSKLEDLYIVNSLELILKFDLFYFLWVFNICPFLSHLSMPNFKTHQARWVSLSDVQGIHKYLYSSGVSGAPLSVRIVTPVFISVPLFPLSRFYVISFPPWSSYLAEIDFSNCLSFPTA